MSNLYKFGLRDLPPEEVILIKTIFRLSSDQLAHQWMLVDDGPVDAWIADSTSWEADCARAARGEISIPTLYLSRSHTAAVGAVGAVLMRPIRAVGLLQWLLKTAQELPALVQPEFVDTQTDDLDRWAATKPAGLMAATDNMVPVLAAEPFIQAQPLVQTVVPEPVIPLQLPVKTRSSSLSILPSADPSDAPQLDHDSRYLLRRWPPAQIMGNDPKRLRITSLLSKQALQVDELSNLSGASVEECEGWMSTLLHSELLDTRTGSGLNSATAGRQASRFASRHAQGSQAAMGAPQKRALGLVSAIRRRLGI